MSSLELPIAMTIRAEPGWRAVLKKPLQRPPQPEDMPDEPPYKLVIQPIRFWGFTVPTYDETLRRKPDVPRVPAAVSAEGARSGRMFGEGGALISSVQHMRPEQVAQPVPLAKGRKRFVHLVDVVGPNETDAAALERIEGVYEAQREIERLKKVLFVMES